MTSARTGEEREEEMIFRKLQTFMDLLADLRRESLYLPVSRLIGRIFDRTGYDKYAAAMPAGKTRQANLAMLVQKAEDYEKTSYQGLFDFIRYIEKLKKYNTDFGEASRSGEHDDAVRIMSIHKSKGLEFPVVFLAGCGKKFNRQDARGRILIDEELGIAADFLDPVKKVKAPTLKKNALARRSNLENMGEELRILYVAMTRAKERLTMTCTRQRMLFGRTSVSEPSRFLEEVPSENADWVGRQAQGASGFGDTSFDEGSSYSTRGYGSYGQGAARYDSVMQRRPKSQASQKLAAQKPAASAPLLQLSSGDQIHHKTFGDGLVISVTPMGGDALLEVAFDTVGTKKLMLKTAGVHITKL